MIGAGGDDDGDALLAGCRRDKGRHRPSRRDSKAAAREEDEQKSATTMIRRSAARSAWLEAYPSRFKRLVELGDAHERGLAALALLLDHLLGRALDEIGIGELGVDLGDIGLSRSRSLERRVRSAPMSMTPASGSAAISPRTRICADCAGGSLAVSTLESRASRFSTASQCASRAFVSSPGAIEDERDLRAAGTFISARTERISVTRSMSQPISASACGLSRPSSSGQGASARTPRARGFAGLCAKARPQLLGDERHEGMEQLHRAFEHEGDGRARLFLLGPVLALQDGLRELEIPIAETVPDEAIDRRRPPR